MADLSGKEPQPQTGDQGVAATPTPEDALPAAPAMGNQAFGRALEAARENQLARFPIAMPGAPSIPSIASEAARGVWDIGSRVRGAVEGAAEAVIEGAQGAAGATIDKAALTGRVTAIAREGLDAWTTTSTIVGVTINGPTGFGGSLVGAPLMVFMQSAGAAPPAEAAVQAKALRGFADAFERWCATFHMPGMPLWPSFAAVPSPVAPATRSIPMPLALLAPAPLPLTLVGSDEREQEALDEAAAGLRAAFVTWKAGRMVTLQGTGPVPTFAPPYVPVGPVVGGTGFAPPPAL